MNITLDIKCPELAEAINNLAAVMGNRELQAPPLRDIVKPAEKPFLGAVKAVSPPKTAKIKAEPEAVAELEPVEPGGEPVEEAAAEHLVDVDYTQVKAAVMKVSTAKGRQAAVDLLAEFNAKVGGDLTEEQWGPFLTRAEEVLG